MSCRTLLLLRLQVFALSEELGLWLLLDDEQAQLVGQWHDVTKLMAAKRLQPSLLFYELDAGNGDNAQQQQQHVEAPPPAAAAAVALAP